MKTKKVLVLYTVYHLGLVLHIVWLRPEPIHHSTRGPVFGEQWFSKNGTSSNQIATVSAAAEGQKLSVHVPRMRSNFSQLQLRLGLGTSLVHGLHWGRGGGGAIDPSL